MVLTPAAPLLILLAAAAQAHAPPRPALGGVHVRVELATPDGDARVTARYAFSGVADSVILSAVPFFGLDIVDVSASADDRSAVVRVTRAGTRALEVHVLPAGGARELELRYRVPGAGRMRGGDVDLRVPVLLPRAEVAGSADGFFRAELAAAGLHVVETFPTVARSGATAGDAYALSLPVAPALLRWRLTAGAPPRVGFAATVDTALLALLAILGVLGARALRRLGDAA